MYGFQPGAATQELPYGIYYFTENLIFTGMNIYLPHFGQSSFITKHVLWLIHTLFQGFNVKFKFNPWDYMLYMVLGAYQNNLIKNKHFCSPTRLTNKWPQTRCKSTINLNYCCYKIWGLCYYMILYFHLMTIVLYYHIGSNSVPIPCTDSGANMRKYRLLNLLFDW